MLPHTFCASVICNLRIQSSNAGRCSLHVMLCPSPKQQAPPEAQKSRSEFLPLDPWPHSALNPLTPKTFASLLQLQSPCRPHNPLSNPSFHFIFHFLFQPIIHYWGTYPYKTLYKPLYCPIKPVSNPISRYIYIYNPIKALSPSLRCTWPAGKASLFGRRLWLQLNRVPYVSYSLNSSKSFM